MSAAIVMVAEAFDPTRRDPEGAIVIAPHRTGAAIRELEP